MKSWKTTVLGIIAIASAVMVNVAAVIDGDPTTVPDWNTVWLAIASLSAGVGLLAARDNDKSSESVGAK